MSEALQPGTQIQGQVIEQWLRAVPDGHLYRVSDVHTGRRATLHEYLPPGVAVRDAVQVSPVSGRGQEFRLGLHRFVLRARQLRQLDHPALPKLWDLWSCRGTSYVLMPPLGEQSLAERVIADNGRVAPSVVWPWLRTCCEVAELLHAQGRIHGAWDPQAIWVRTDGELTLPPPLVDGSAVVASPWMALEQSVLAPGKAQRGPWTDVFGIAAVAAFMLTGDSPNTVQRRALGASAPVLGLAAGQLNLPEQTLSAIRAALHPNPRERPQSIEQFRSLLGLAPPPLLLREPASALDPWDQPTIPDPGRDMGGHIWLDDLVAPAAPAAAAAWPPATLPGELATLDEPLLPSSLGRRRDDEEALRDLMQSLKEAPDVLAAAREHAGATAGAAATPAAAPAQPAPPVMLSTPLAASAAPGDEASEAAPSAAAPEATPAPVAVAPATPTAAPIAPPAALADTTAAGTSATSATAHLAAAKADAAARPHAPLPPATPVEPSESTPATPPAADAADTASGGLTSIRPNPANAATFSDAAAPGGAREAPASTPAPVRIASGGDTPSPPSSAWVATTPTPLEMPLGRMASESAPASPPTLTPLVLEEAPEMALVPVEGSPASFDAEPSPRRRSPLVPLAAAATVLAVVVGLWFVVGQPATTTTAARSTTPAAGADTSAERLLRDAPPGGAVGAAPNTGGPGGTASTAVAGATGAAATAAAAAPDASGGSGGSGGTVGATGSVAGGPIDAGAAAGPAAGATPAATAAAGGADDSRVRAPAVSVASAEAAGSAGRPDTAATNRAASPDGEAPAPRRTGPNRLSRCSEALLEQSLGLDPSPASVSRNCRR